MVSIQVTNTTSREKAEKFASVIAGKSYMDFAVSIAPYQGMLVVTAQTWYTDDTAEAQDMLIGLMFDAMTN